MRITIWIVVDMLKTGSMDLRRLGCIRLMERLSVQNFPLCGLVGADGGTGGLIVLGEGV